MLARGLGIAVASVLLAPTPVSAQDLTLDLAGEWRATLGDDPAWAHPDFDDSGWDTVTLPESDDAQLASGGFAWYRRTVRIDDELLRSWTSTDVAIGVGGSSGSTAFQVWVDGDLAGQHGTLRPEPDIAPLQWRVFDVPPPSLRDGRVVVALRVWQLEAIRRFELAQPRWRYGPFRLGAREPVELHSELEESDHTMLLAIHVGVGSAALLVVLFHLLIWRGRRELHAYFWYATYVGFVGLRNVLWIRGEDVWPYYDMETALWVEPMLYTWMSVCAWEFLFAFYDIRRPKWWWTYWVFKGVQGALFYVPSITEYVYAFDQLASGLQFLIVIVIVVVLAWRRGRAERIVAVSMLAYLAVMLTTVLLFLGAPLGDYWSTEQGMAVRQLAPLALFVVAMAYALAEKFDAKLSELDRSYAASRRFVPAKFLALLGRERVTDVARGDSVAREMTVMFADIRSFTGLSERLGAEKTFAFMNEYHAIMEPVITKEGGFINQYYGDGIMALFDTPDAALRAARGMRRALDEFNESHESIDIGIGVHTGEVMLGTIGGEQRLDTGVISDAVNTASRLQDLTKEYGEPVLVSGATRSGASAPDELREVDRVTPKGKTEEIALYAPLTGTGS